MAERTTELDKFRGMAERRATESRRRQRTAVSGEEERRRSRDEFEGFLFREPAKSWGEAAAKARYLLTLLTTETSDPRLDRLVSAVLSDFDRLLAARRED